MKFLRNLSVRGKLALNSGLLIVLLLVGSLYAINSMKLIGSELVAIAEQDIPLTEVVTRITEHQLEQAIHFERAVRYAVLVGREEGAKEYFQKEVKHFDKLNAKVDSEIIEGEEKAQNAIDHAHTAADKKEFEHILEVLKTVEKHHKEFAVHAHQAFDLLKQGKILEAEKLTKTIEKEEDQLTNELEALLKEIEEFTYQAALTAEQHELEALDTLTVLFIVSLVVAFISTWLAIKAIVSPIKELTSKLSEVEQTCNFNLRANVKSEDEVGQAATAFNNLMNAQQTAMGSVINVMTGLADGVFGRRV
ncbi:MAG: cell wall metabolism sensor histidine kinase WalK, partial [Pseudomonadales bacterium]|nr:cell wall metabolism sensor histidine kinase WalK [Pseudomonadales bacterium]